MPVSKLFNYAINENTFNQLCISVCTFLSRWVSRAYLLWRQPMVRFTGAQCPVEFTTWSLRNKQALLTYCQTTTRKWTVRPNQLLYMRNIVYVRMHLVETKSLRNQPFLKVIWANNRIVHQKHTTDFKNTYCWTKLIRFLWDLNTAILFEWKIIDKISQFI